MICCLIVKLMWQIDKDALGKDAGTVFRDKSGRKRDLAAEKEKDEEEAKRKSAMDQKYKEWGQGWVVSALDSTLSYSFQSILSIWTFAHLLKISFFVLSGLYRILK